ncbi:long-chain fatty acid--CoA ligase [Planktomarina temperata]|nr:long-chain fatty acid--CoA ligase [Planktomarina temperata]
MFWNTRDKITDDRTFIISDHATYSFSDIFQMGDGLFANHARGVCIIACQKTVETVAAYLGCLRAGIVPLLIDANLASSNIIDLAEKYQAETILTLQTLDLENYYYCGKFGVLKLYQIKKQSKTNLNTELTLLLPTSGSTGDPKCVRLTAKKSRYMHKRNRQLFKSGRE